MDTRIKYIDLGGIYARKGDCVTCENGHAICMFTRLVKCGEPFDKTALAVWSQSIPEIGGPMPICANCSRPFVRGLGGEFHFCDGWRTVTPAKPTATGWLKKLWRGLTSR